MSADLEARLGHHFARPELLPRALRALPRGSAFVFRHYHLDPRARRARWDELLPLVREGGHLAVLSGSDDEALR